MIELQIINKIIQDGNMGFIRKYRLTTEHFFVLGDILTFIEEHYRRYGVVPDKATVASEFEDFEVIGVTESEEYLAKKIKEGYLFERVAPVIEEMASIARRDSFEAVDFIKQKTREIMDEIGENEVGTDIVEEAGERLDEYVERTEREGLLGITTGIEELDKVLYGWLKEDLAVIFGRTNEGKSWLLLYFLVMAWKIGYNILLYSGELSKVVIGFRFDTLNKNFSNMGLMSGSNELDREGQLGINDYEGYINELKEVDNKFIVVTPKDFGGKRPTVDELGELAEFHNVDMLGIDQISLMDDQRNGSNNTVRFTQIAEDLYALTERLKIPILAVAQAGREKDKKKNKDKAPELEDIYMSDGIAQNSKRVLSIRAVDNLLKINVRKNTYGLNNKEAIMVWNIDYGELTPFINLEEEEEQEEESNVF